MILCNKKIFCKFSKFWTKWRFFGEVTHCQCSIANAALVNWRDQVTLVGRSDAYARISLGSLPKILKLFQKPTKVRVPRATGWSWGHWCWRLHFCKLISIVKIFQKKSKILGPWMCYQRLFKLSTVSCQKGQRIKAWKNEAGFSKLF